MDEKVNIGVMWFCGTTLVLCVVGMIVLAIVKTDIPQTIPIIATAMGSGLLAVFSPKTGTVAKATLTTSNAEISTDTDTTSHTAS